MIKYQNDKLNLDESERKYLSNFIKENQDSFNIGDFPALTSQCYFMARAALIKMLFLSDMQPLFDKCIYAFSFSRSDIIEFIVPKSIQLIENHTFTLTHLWKISFEESCQVALIQNNAFEDTEIEEFKCPEGLMHLDSEVFKNCTALKKFYLNNGICSIGRACFDGCNQLREIHYEGTKAEFENVDLDDAWLKGSNIKEIICKDGVVGIYGF